MTRGYPKKYPFDHRRAEKCKNKELVKAGFFWIDRTITDGQYTFTASLKREPWIRLSRAPSSRGFLERVWTDKDSQRCGLGKAITHTIFKDDKVTHNGGVNPKHDISIWTDQDKMAENAFDNCLTIIFLICQPEDAPIGICKTTYLDVARENNFQMMFTDNIDQGYGTPYQVLSVIEAIKKFEEDPLNFLEEYGKGWFFCKCTPRKKQDCLNMGRN